MRWRHYQVKVEKTIGKSLKHVVVVVIIVAVGVIVDYRKQLTDVFHLRMRHAPYAIRLCHHCCNLQIINFYLTSSIQLTNANRDDDGCFSR